METNVILQGNVLDILKVIPSDSIDMALTSPPYFGLRNYQIPSQVFGGASNCMHDFDIKKIKDPMDRGGNGDHDREGGLSGTKIDYKDFEVGYCKKCNAWKGNLGLEDTPNEYINHLIEIFSEVMRVLKPTGVFFLNIGDSYGSHLDSKSSQMNKVSEQKTDRAIIRNSIKSLEKQKLLIPHRVAIAMQDKGFIVRDDIVWVKKLNIYPDLKSVGSTMPFPVKDKLLPSTEYIFQIVKNKKYFFNLEDVKTQIKNSTIERAKRPISSTYTNDVKGNPYIGHSGMVKKQEEWKNSDKNPSKANPTNAIMFRRMNQHSKNAVQQHFASYPVSLAEYFVKVGCPEGGIVLDPFMGSGTTAISAVKDGKKFIGIELNEKYIEIAKKRLEPYLCQMKL